VIKQHSRTRWAALAVIVMASTLVACGQSPTVKFYTLSPSGSSAAGGGSDLAVAVGPATLPPTLDRKQIVTRASNTQVTVDEFNVWSAPLDFEFLRVLGDNIATGLHSDRVVVYPREAQFPVDYRVLLDVVQFDGALGQSVVLRVRWTITGPGNAPAAIGTFETTQSIRGNDQSYDALVAAHSAAVGELGAAITAKLEALGKPAQKKAPHNTD
jgi:uncharacterized lipoprotein YmbA